MYRTKTSNRKSSKNQESKNTMYSHADLCCRGGGSRWRSESCESTGEPSRRKTAWEPPRVAQRMAAICIMICSYRNILGGRRIDTHGSPSEDTRADVVA